MFAHVWEELICETAEVLAAVWYLSLQPASSCCLLKTGDSHCCTTSETAEPVQKGGIAEHVAEPRAGEKLAGVLQERTLSQIQRIQRILSGLSESFR